jgi:release factor glutamine methyltransferase
VTREAEYSRLAGLDCETTLDSARRGLTEAFRAGGLPSASLDARVLTCAALGIDHVDLVREPGRRLGSAAEILRDFARRRLGREPVSRITGVKEFWGLPLAIDRHVLDPRPDTETLIEAILDRLAPGRSASRNILDLGTGSGAILCGLLSSLPNAFGIGVDISYEACAIARRNLAMAGFAARSAILCSDWTTSIRGFFDVIVSNPPYIPSSELSSLDPEVRAYDPHLALDGGTDGLESYRSLAPRLALLLAENGLVGFEIGAEQAARVTTILGAAGFETMAPIRDLAGRDRVVMGRLQRVSPMQTGRPLQKDSQRARAAETEIDRQHS